MKLFFTIITLILCFTINAQDFTDTNHYRLTDYSKILNTTKIDYNKSFEIALIKDDEPLVKLISLSKNDLDLFLDTKIDVLKNPDLNNIKEVIRVRFEFLDTCIKFETQYFLVTYEDLLIKLPVLSYSQCEQDANKQIEYLFPNQKFGKENTIIQSLSFINEENVIESIKIKKLIIWEEQVAITQNTYNNKEQ